MKPTLKLLAPYIAVGIFWCGFSSAWLAILAYHAQILFWSRGRLFELRWPVRKRVMILALPAALAGPLLYGLLPYMTRTDLSAWLACHHLSGPALAAMIPYFGLIHPFLEQVHWAPLRESTPAAHLLFAGYHVVVLFSLLTMSWLIVCFAILVTASWTWQQMKARTGSLGLPFASHVLADLGIVLAAWWKA